MTGLQVHVPDEVKDGWIKDAEAGKYMKSPEQGAATTVYAALSKEWEGKGGRYLEDCGEAAQSEGNSALSLGHASHAYNEQGEKKLWADSLKFVRLDDDQ